MNSYRINQRYALALFEFAVERNEVEQTFKDAQLINIVCDENRALRLLLKSPVVFSEKKLSVLKEILKDKIGTTILSFIEVLIRKRREEHLCGITKALVDIYYESRNIKIAHVTTALPLTDKARQQLLDRLTAQSGSTIILKEEIDPEIIGGLIVKIEGVKFDDSIRKKIQNLRQEFNVNVYIREF